MRDISNQEWKALLDVQLEPAGLKLMEALDNGVDIRAQAFWDGLPDPVVALDLPWSAVELPSGCWVDSKTGGIYLAVGFLAAILAAIYVGKSSYVPSRLASHLI
ncbi:hypothetical protein BDZ90DRAFT_258292 [Jaminaea rosea]|uniref:Uncharacterized protein n=1 Tax=Jaminaea rosea TaxID=1569628 RepID=A0A316UVN6_9BASI|nr:hypothetical protein BDZ90DRAFT_258292 [Jaminaea rosea]PWN29360.1 hypothetical protein BDZ90DRAFT_258292 [Jaminaea rosea]